MSAFRDSFNALPAIPLPENSCLKRSEIFGPNSEKHFRKDGVGGGLLEATPPPRLTPPRSLRARRPIYRSGPFLKKNYSQKQSNYPRPPLSSNKTLTEKIEPAPETSSLKVPPGNRLRPIVDRSFCQGPQSSIMRFGGLMGLPCAAVEADVPSGRLGHRWRRFSLPGWFGGSAQPIRLWRRLRRFLGGGRSLNVVCSWGASRRNQAKSGHAGWNVGCRGHSGRCLSGVVRTVHSQQRKFRTATRPG